MAMGEYFTAAWLCGICPLRDFLIHCSVLDAALIGRSLGNMCLGHIGQDRLFFKQIYRDVAGYLERAARGGT